MRKGRSYRRSERRSSQERYPRRNTNSRQRVLLSPATSFKYQKRDYYSLYIYNFPDVKRRDQIESCLYHEFRKFGDVTIEVKRDVKGNRVAYAHFRSSNGARRCRTAPGHLLMYGNRLVIEPVYERRSVSLSPLRYDHEDHYESRYRYDEVSCSSRRHDNSSSDHERYSRHKNFRQKSPIVENKRRSESEDEEVAKETEVIKPNFFLPAGIHDKPVPPEDDPSATRTLFVGNLESEITEKDILDVFGMFGEIQEIDIKKTARNQTYCFVHFTSLDNAYHAKVSLNGTALISKPIRIGYGKVVPSRRVWIGGLGTLTRRCDLEKVFGRFGAIVKIDYRRGDRNAEVVYESAVTAVSAVKELRGFLMPGTYNRLRLDFLDLDVSAGIQQKRKCSGNYHKKNFDFKKRFEKSRNRIISLPDPVKLEMQFKQFYAKNCHDLHELCSCFDPPCWQGGLVLKEITFPTIFFLLNGDISTFNYCVADRSSPTGRKLSFSCNYRLSMTDEKLNKIRHRMKTCVEETCLILAVPGIPEHLNILKGSEQIQHKPLRGLVKYFKQKNAAAIIKLPGQFENKEQAGTLHAFPPGCMATEQLLSIGPCLQPQYFTDEYLVILSVKGKRALA